MRTRKSRMRTLVMLVLLLIGGAIINVAVAWGCALLPSQDFTGGCEVDEQTLLWLTRTNGAIDWKEERWDESHDTYSYIPYFVSFACIGKQEFHFVGPPYATSGAGSPKVVQSRTGWPCLSLLATFVRTHPNLDEWQNQCGISLEATNGRRALPLWPLWPGFAINTIFYAAIPWLLFAAPIPLRRWRRVKRGLCPKCAYPIGASDTCTECGRPVKRTIIAQKAGAA